MGEVHRRKALLYYSADERFLMWRWKTFLSPPSGCWHAGHSSSLQLPVVTLCMDSICAFNLECNNVQKWKVKEEEELRNTTAMPQIRGNSNMNSVQVNQQCRFYLCSVTTAGQGYGWSGAFCGDTRHKVEHILDGTVRSHLNKIKYHT